MRFTRRQLRYVIREAIAGNVHGDPKKERFLDIAMNAMADGDTDRATSAILDSFWMDDTWPAEEDALEAQLAALAPGASQEEVEAIADQWLIDYRSGSLRPGPEEYEAQWAMGSSPSSARRKKRLGEATTINEGFMIPLQPFSEGYMVPDFESTEDMQLFLDELEPEEEVEQDVMDPESGEIWILAGEAMGEQEWFEGEVEDAPEESNPDELDNYDWDAHDRAYEEEREAKIRAQQDAWEKVLDKTIEHAKEAGKDWAMDTMHDAVNNPGMWQDSGMTQSSSAGEYVMGVGQDAAGDIADGIVNWSMDKEDQDVIDDLPSEQQAGMGAYGSSFMRDEAGRPSKQLFKEIIADHVYDGVAKGVEEFKKREGVE
jgi:hypothetical protein